MNTEQTSKNIFMYFFQHIIKSEKMWRFKKEKKWWYKIERIVSIECVI